MYQEGSDQYKYHVEKYGHPSKFGFKDVINEWNAEEWNPNELLALYKKAGAKYFVALANHHDNFDLYDSRHQPWNSTRLGPKKDLMGGWAKAAKKQGLRFGVSVHAAHTWSWLETAQRADKNGPLAVTTANGQGGGRATTRRPSTPKTTRSVRTARTTADYRAGSWQSAPAPIRTLGGVARVHWRPVGF
jgi:alpha-L-fucosidase